MNDFLIVEDHPVVAEGLQKLLTENGICKACPVAQTGKECLEILKNYIPEFIFMDINLPDVSGIDLCKTILSKYPAIRIVALSSFGSRSFIERILENGARGYLLKNSDGEEIIKAIEKVKKGETYYSESVRAILENRADDGVPVLTRREQEVLKYISDGLTNNEIADKMFISPLTVDSHRKNLLLKLCAKNTASLVKIAMTHNLIKE
jgi:DNA-binding NarL/FixJ family response regulator